MDASLHIVIVNYNAGDWLLRSVASALHPRVTQLTVVDNCSADNSVENVKRQLDDPRIQWIENQDNRGFAAANNQVLETLDADFAVLLNPDCELRTETLDKMLEAFEQHPRLALASCIIENEDGEVAKTSKRRFPTPSSALARMLKLNRVFPHTPSFADFDYASAADKATDFQLVDAISGAFMVVRRTAMQEVGALDEGYFMHCEDLDWCKRFALADWQVGYVGTTSVVHAKGVSTQSRPLGVLWNLHSGMARFFDKFYRQETPLPMHLVIKCGIYLSFVGRAVLGWGKSLAASSRGRKAK